MKSNLSCLQLQEYKKYRYLQSRLRQNSNMFHHTNQLYWSRATRIYLDKFTDLLLDFHIHLYAGQISLNSADIFDLTGHILSKKTVHVNVFQILNLILFFITVVQYKQDAFKCKQFNVLTQKLQSQKNKDQLHLIFIWKAKNESLYI